jgi:hypothetical protein
MFGILRRGVGDGKNTRSSNGCAMLGLDGERVFGGMVQGSERVFPSRPSSPVTPPEET